MGLFSRIATNIGRVFQDVAPIVSIVSPIAGGALALGGGILGPQPSTAGGAAAVVRQNIAAPQCPPPGFQGARSPAANPITRAAIFPPFDTSRLPARPVFGAIQTQLAQQPQFQFPQTTSFRQQGFGASVSPSFRPFAPSFRSGIPGVQGQFFPGVSQGFAPAFAQPQFQAAGFGGGGVFNRFGGFGF